MNAYPAPARREPHYMVKDSVSVLGVILTPIGLWLTCYGVGLRFVGSVASAFGDAFAWGDSNAAPTGDGTALGTVWLLSGVAILLLVAATAGYSPWGAMIGGSLFGVLPGVLILALTGTEAGDAFSSGQGKFDASSLVFAVAGTTHLPFVGGLMLVGAALASMLRAA